MKISSASLVGCLKGKQSKIPGNKKHQIIYLVFFIAYSGSGEIRTHGPLTRTPVFKTGAFDHSATLPCVVRVHSTIHHMDFQRRHGRLLI